MKFLLALSLFLISAHCYGVDLKFRFKDDYCQKNGAPGFNPSFFGECGNLTKTRFINEQKNEMNLKGANFNSTYSYLLHFKKGNLSRTSFKRSNILQTSFENLQADFMDLSGATLKSVIFKEVSLKKLLARGSRLVKVQFIDCNLKGANFWGANLQQANFSGSDLSGANLMETSRLFTRFKNAKFNEKTQLPFSDEEALQKGMIKVD